MSDDLEQRLIGAAHREAAQRGWTWIEPVEARLTRAVPGDRQWTVVSNAHGLGSKARVVIREVDLSVVEAGYIPR